MKYSNIGGQAVMEGIMMKNGDHYAVAVRKPNALALSRTRRSFSSPSSAACSTLWIRWSWV